MLKNKCLHEAKQDFTPDFTCALALQSPENALQVVGFFSNGTLTCADTQACAPLVRDALKHCAIKEGEKIFISPNILVMAANHPDTLKGWQELGAKLLRAVPADRVGALILDALSWEEVAAAAYGCEVSSWRLERFHTAARPLPPRCKKAVIVTVHAEDEDFKKQRAQDHHLAQSVHWARDIANRPGNDITPEHFMRCVDAFKDLGITVNVLDQEALEKKGFGALLGVAQGSIHKPYVVTAEWRGAGADVPMVALVGKGVTFDTGGISIKPSNNMGEMKLDKTGAVVVAATVRTLALQKACVNVVAVLALVENMPSGSAQRPGDIVTSLSGQTIEVLDTDAEGRLILADALTYVEGEFSPSVIIDIATLTGAVRAALGPVYAGVFSRHNDLVSQLVSSGEKTGEALWPLPLHKEYDEAMNSNCADMKNISGPGFGAGSSTAAQFLARFVKKDQRWAHLDIAGVDMAGKETVLCPRGGSAFGVQLLVRWLLDHHDSVATGSDACR
jgi:leucyl aminopeptidase